MAAVCLGAFGAYKFSYSKYLKERESRDRPLSASDTVWVTKRYIPSDLRVTAPVPRHKLVAPGSLPFKDEDWVPANEAPLRGFDRSLTDRSTIHPSRPHTRSEEWSTLRQTLPSRGGHVKVNPPNWGAGFTIPPIMTRDHPERFPIVNSPMTRFVDDMHSTNRQFSLY